MRTIKLILVLNSLAAVAGECAAIENGLPVTIHVKSRDQGKGHFCMVELRLANRHDFPVWFVFSDNNELLRYDGRFNSDYKPDPLLSNKIPFEAEEYDEDKGRAIFVSHYGRDGFRAVLLPAKGSFHFGGFAIHSFSEPARFIDVWEVKSLKVNEKTPLEQWLPYSISSSTSVEITGRMYSGKQKVLRGKGESAPADNVKNVVAEPLRRYVIPLPE